MQVEFRTPLGVSYADLDHLPLAGERFRGAIQPEERWRKGMRPYTEPVEGTVTTLTFVGPDARRLHGDPRSWNVVIDVTLDRCANHPYEPLDLCCDLKMHEHPER